MEFFCVAEKTIIITGIVLAIPVGRSSRVA